MENMILSDSNSVNTVSGKRKAEVQIDLTSSSKKSKTESTPQDAIIYKFMNILLGSGASGDPIVLLGATSAGKSSFLVRFTRKRLVPTSSGICTKFGQRYLVLRQEPDGGAYELTTKGLKGDDGSSLTEDKIHTSDPDQIRERVRQISSYRAKTRSYGGIIKITMRDPKGMPLLIYDFPGPLCDSDDREVNKLCGSVEDHKRPIVLVVTNPTLSECDVRGDKYLRSLLASASEAKSRAIVGITHIDDIINWKSYTEKNGPEILVETCKELWEDYNKRGIDLEFVLAQTGSSKTNDIEELEQEEQANLKRFMEMSSNIDKTKPNGKPLFFYGVPELLLQISAGILKNIEENRLAKVLAEHQTKLAETTKKLDLGKIVHRPRNMIGELSPKLNSSRNESACIEAFQKSFWPAICGKAEEIFESRKIPQPSKMEDRQRGYAKISEGDRAQEDEETYRDEARAYIKEIAKISPEICEMMIHCMINGKGMIEMYAAYQEYPKFSTWLKNQFEAFIQRDKNAIREAIEETILLTLYCLSVVGARNTDAWISNSKMVATCKTNPIVSKLVTSLIPIFETIERMLVLSFSKRIIHEFPKFLNQAIMSEENLEIPEMSPQETVELKKQIEELDESVKTLEKIKESLDEEMSRANSQKSKSFGGKVAGFFGSLF